MTIRIAFSGWAGAGKTEAAKYIARKFDIDVISFADGIKYIDRYLFGFTKKDRSRLQRIGEFFRGFDPNIWVNRTIESVEAEGSAVIDDLRRTNEYEALVDAGFKIYRIVADEEIRIKRLIERDGECDISLLYNESERGCANILLPEIENNGSLEEFYAKLDQIFGDIK